RAGKNVCRTGDGRAFVALVSVDPDGATRLLRSTDGHRVLRERNTASEVAVGPRIGGLDVCLLRPRRPDSLEDVNGAGVPLARITLIAVHADSSTQVSRSAHRERVFVERHAQAELRVSARVGSFDVRLLRPAALRPREYVDRAGPRRPRIVLVA